ncbi:MAG: hypothetical protein KME47_09980 [Nodosilinea sp. WJT8-NPBG4]|jgi:hypothetical protein|nr:hypothetical protein [Nodosilinea sp. WJT8-NPBG4]
MDRPTKLDLYMRTKFNLSDDWYHRIIESTNNGVLIKGESCRLKTRGKNKGQPSFPSKESDLDVYSLNDEEYKESFQ